MRYIRTALFLILGFMVGASGVAFAEEFSFPSHDDSLLVPEWSMWTCHERKVLYRELTTSICNIPGKPNTPGFVVWFGNDKEPVVVAWGYDTSLATEEARWENAHAALHLYDGRWIIGQKFMVTWNRSGSQYILSLLDKNDFEIAGKTFAFPFGT